MNGDLSKAFIFEPVRCLGQALKPLCLGHLLMLEKMDNAFVVGRSEVSIEDIVWAVSICSQDYGDELLNWIGSDDCENDLRQLGEAVGAFDVQKKTDILCKYFNEGISQPKCWSKDEESGMKADWKAHLMVALMSDLNMDYREILSGSLRGFLYLVLTNQERHGLIEIHGERHRDLLEMAKAREAKMEAMNN